MKSFSKLVPQVSGGMGEERSGVHYGEVEGLVCVERWSCNRDASCVVEYTMGRLRDWPL